MRRYKSLLEVRFGGYFRCPNSSRVLKKIREKEEYSFGNTVYVFECADKYGNIYHLPDNNVERAYKDEIECGVYNSLRKPLNWR